MTGNFISTHKPEIILAGILFVSAFLDIWNLWNQGFSNTYYAAAVRSMLANPAAAFFSSFDAAGFITVDKPPVGLWVQAAFAAILGYSGWVLDLPQVLAGVASAALMYCIVARPFGKPAGLVAAFALSITPIFVATARNQTMDLQLIFVILLAVWASLKAARENSFRYLAFAIVLVGIGFNIKMIQAFIVVPAILAVYVLGTSIPFRRKTLHLAAAILILLIVSLSWAVAVDCIPADQRPYIGSSGDNTVFGLMFGHNGIERLESTENGMSGGGAGPFTASVNSSGGRPGNFAAGSPGPGSRSYNETRVSAAGGLPDGSGMPSQPGGTRDMGGQGTRGIFRFYDADIAGQISWLLPLALIGLLAWVRRPVSFPMKGLSGAGYFSEKGLTLTAMVLWLFSGLLYFSFTSGFWHTYYLATIAPPLAALVGTGLIGMYETWQREGPAGWLLVAAVLITGLLEVRILLYDPDFSGLLIPVVFTGTILSFILLTGLRTTGKNSSGKLPAAAILITLAILFAAPVAWACTPMGYSGGDTLPTAGPQGGNSGGNQMQANFSGPGARYDAMTGRPGTMVLPGQDNGQSVNGNMPPVAGNLTASSPDRLQPDVSGQAGAGGATMPTDGGGTGNTGGSSTEELAAYLLAHFDGETYLAATTGTRPASGLIIATGKPVMALGGFLGTDQPLTPEEFRDLVKNGTVRYFVASGGGMDGGTGNSAIVTWVESSCSPVTDLPGAGNITALFDCAGADE